MSQMSLYPYVFVYCSDRRGNGWKINTRLDEAPQDIADIQKMRGVRATLTPPPKARKRRQR